MNISELNSIAHHFTYLELRNAIENTCPWKEAPNVFGPGRWYDPTAPIRDTTARQNVQLAMKYLRGRGLIHQHSELPYLVMVLPERKDGEVLPMTVEPIEATA